MLHLEALFLSWSASSEWTFRSTSLDVRRRFSASSHQRRHRAFSMLAYVWRRTRDPETGAAFAACKTAVLSPIGPPSSA